MAGRPISPYSLDLAREAFDLRWDSRKHAPFTNRKDYAEFFYSVVDLMRGLDPKNMPTHKRRYATVSAVVQELCDNDSLPSGFAIPDAVALGVAPPYRPRIKAGYVTRSAFERLQFRQERARLYQDRITKRHYADTPDIIATRELVAKHAAERKAAAQAETDRIFALLPRNRAQAQTDAANSDAAPA